MALEADALLSPTGRLQAAVLWPGVTTATVTAKLEAFLLEAVGLTDDADAQREWAYYRAFDEVYQRMLLMPSSVTFADEGSGSYAVEQMRLVKELRDQALAAYEELIVVGAGGSTGYTVLTSFR